MFEEQTKIYVLKELRNGVKSIEWNVERLEDPWREEYGAIICPKRIKIIENDFKWKITRKLLRTVNWKWRIHHELAERFDKIIITTGAYYVREKREEIFLCQSHLNTPKEEIKE